MPIGNTFLKNDESHANVEASQALLTLIENFKSKLYEALLPSSQLKQEFFEELKKLRSQYE